MLSAEVEPMTFDEIIAERERIRLEKEYPKRRQGELSLCLKVPE